MLSHKTSAESGSLMLELCIALAFYSLTVVGIYGALNMLNKQLK